MNFSQRWRMTKIQVAIHSHVLRRSIRFEGSALVGVALWMLRPSKRSLVHIDEGDAWLHPMGARWRVTAAFPWPQCSHCRSMHPRDFIELVEQFQRWKPYEAHQEMMQLIERGEAERTPMNYMRSGHIPDGFAVMAVRDFSGEAAIHVHTHDHMNAFVNLAHLSDLGASDFRRFQRWQRAIMPELISEHDENGVVVNTYDPAADPMNKPPTLIVMGTPHEHDEDDDPTGDPDE